MRFIQLIALFLALTFNAVGGEKFRIFAPSSKNNSLWIVDATPQGDGLKLSVNQKVDLGFAAKIITSHPSKPLLYLTAVKGDTGNTPGVVVKLSQAGDYQALQPVTLNDGACFLSLDRTESFLFGVSYGNGRLNVYPLDSTGIPQKAVTTIDQKRKAAHCVIPSPDNSFIYIPYVKDSLAIFQYRFNETDGSLTPLEPLDAKPPEGTGPRHMAYHLSLPFVYFSNEQGVGLSTYKMNKDGQLKLHQNIEVLPDGMTSEGISASDLKISPDGKYLFAGLRGQRQDFDKITRYRIKDNGDAEFLGFTDADKVPWGLEISPNGKYLLVSATSGASLTAYRITDQGDLIKAGELQWDAGISDLIAR